jgi:hypothetical protein
MVDVARVKEAGRLAAVRLAHVSNIGQSLSDSIAAWMAQDPLRTTRSIAKDRLSWELRWVVKPPPPMEEWGLMFGDGMHNLRAMLDNLLHFIAHEEGADAEALGKVQFPVVSDPDKWAGQGWRIAMLPTRVQESLRAAQPFNRPEAERRDDGLALLTGFNNLDKHRIILPGLVQPHTINHKFSLAFEGAGVTVEGPPRTTFYPEVIDGALAIHHDTSPLRIASVTGEGQFDGQLVITADDGRTHGMTQVLSALATYLPAVLETVLTAWASEERTAPESPG